jgi:chemotaxis signal transduction protein
VDLILFEVGGRKWAADPWDVVRVDRDAQAGEMSARALVVRGGEGEVRVPIDRLLGFQRVAAESLRPLPPFAQTLASPAVVGAWLLPEEIVLLLDLQALVKESVSLC